MCSLITNIITILAFPSNLTQPRLFELQYFEALSRGIVAHCCIMSPVPVPIKNVPEIKVSKHFERSRLVPYVGMSNTEHDPKQVILLPSESLSSRTSAFVLCFPRQRIGRCIYHGKMTLELSEACVVHRHALTRVRF